MEIPRDKQLHLLAGAIVYLVSFGVGYFLVENKELLNVYSYIAVAIVGTAKEAYDYFKPEEHTSEWLDAFATYLGGIIASVPVWYFFIK